MISMPVQAEQSISIETSFFTTHVAKRDGWIYNEDNKLIAIEYKIDEWYYNISTYNNTQFDRTWTAGLGLNYFTYKAVSFDLLVGAVHGYKEAPLSVMPYIAPRVTLRYEITDTITIKTSTQIFYTAIMATAGIEYKF